MIKTLQNISIPRENGFIFVNPELSEWNKILAENELASKEIQNRQLFCSELINIARNYTQNVLGLISPDINCKNIIATGHQPIWYHCGIWSKDVVAQKFARAVKGTALHIVLDHDICDTSMTLPEKNSDGNLSFKKIEIEPYSIQMAIPNEYRTIPKKETINTFLEQVFNVNCNPIYKEVWLSDKLLKNSVLVSLSTESDLITYLQSLINTTLGLDILYLPVSRLCDSNSFLCFICTVIFNAENFAACYNQGINSLCKTNVQKRGKSIKYLAINKDPGLVELPFWLVSAAGLRSSLWVTTKQNNYTEIGTNLKVFGKIDSSSLEGKIAQLQNLLDCSNLRLRPKAVTLTLFARLFLADIFVHGVGATSYEPVTDYILEHFYSLSSLRYGIATSTMPLFLPKEKSFLRNHISSLKNKLHEIKSNPEKYINKSTLNTEHITTLLQMKREKITQSQDHYSPAEIRKSAWDSISQINMELCSYAKNIIAEHESLLSKAEGEVISNNVSGYREYFFGLFPEKELRRLINSYSEN